MLTMALSCAGMLVAPLVVYAIDTTVILVLGALVALCCHLFRDWL